MFTWVVSVTCHLSSIQNNKKLKIKIKRKIKGRVTIRNVCIAEDNEEEAAEAEEKIAKWIATGNGVATTAPC